MAEPRSRTDRLALLLADGVIRRPWLVLLLALILVAGAGSGARFLEFSTNYRVYFSKQNPELLAFDHFQETYTKNDNILFVLQPEQGTVFSPRYADAIEKITSAAWKIPYAIRVDSISNFQYSWADGDDLTVEDLIRGGASLSETELDRKRTIALAEPLLRGNLISPDTHTTGVNVTLQFPEKSIHEGSEAIAVARRTAEEITGEFPDIRIVLTGLSMLNNAFVESGRKDAMTLVPLMYCILILVMVLTLRSLSATVSTLAVIGFSSITAMGLAGYSGIKLSPPSITAPTIIMTLAIADSIHILISMLSLMGEGRDKAEALRESMRINFLPVSITSVTTVVGFLSMNFSDAPPFRDLGNITAMGIAAAWVYSVFFLPAAVSILPVKVRRGHRDAGGLNKAMDGLAEFVTAHNRKLLIIMGAAVVLLVSRVPGLELNDQFVKYFDHRVEFRNHAEFAIEHLTGIYLIEYSVEADGPGGISEPAYLANLEDFTAWLRSQPEVKHVYSYADIIKRLNRNMHGDDPGWYKVPDDRELSAQYLLLYELSLPYGLDLNDRINIDKSATRVTATLENMSTAGIRRFLSDSGTWLRENTPEYMQAEPTGAAVMFSYISERNIRSMLRGNILAVVLICGILILSLRSLRLGLLSLLPNCAPILMALGLWAMIVGQVGMAAATVAVSSLGIVVDDTVHFLAKYLLARREKGFERPEAIRYAFQTVGMAILATTIILVVGFSVLTLSTFLVNFQLGLLNAIAVAMALVADFFLLPALLLAGHKKGEVKT